MLRLSLAGPVDVWYGQNTSEAGVNRGSSLSPEWGNQLTISKWGHEVLTAWSASDASIRGVDASARVDLQRADDGGVVLELETQERPGLLAAVSKALMRVPVRIVRCEVRSRGDRALHRFHIEQSADSSVEDCDQGLALRQAVFAAVDTAPVVLGICAGTDAPFEMGDTPQPRRH